MGRLVRRVMVVAGAAVMVLGLAVGVAGAAKGVPVLIWSPTTSAGSYSYGALTAGQTASQAFTLANSGSTATGALAVTLTGSPALSKVADTCTGTKLKANTSCVVIIAYAPAASGEDDSAALAAVSGKPAATARLALTGSAKASPGIATSPSAGGPVGTAVTDSVTVTGGVFPAGTIEFKLYGPSDTASCSGTPVSDQEVAVAGDGTYTSPPVTPAPAGTYWWTASYSGDASNTGAATACGDESVTLTKAAPSFSASPSFGQAPGSAVTDSATVTGGASPAGTIEFTLYGPSDTASCTGTPITDQTVTVAGDGTYTSTPVTLTQAGTYWWTASYSGDASNTGTATACGDQKVTIGAHLYWTDTTTGTINEANLDGSDPHTIVTGQAAGPYGIGLAVTASGLYWIARGDIWKASLDGSNPQPIIGIQQASGCLPCFPAGLAATASNLYWTDEYGAVYETNLDGSNTHAIFSDLNAAIPVGVAVSASNVYWTASVDSSPVNRVSEANLDGSNPQVIVSTLPSPAGVAVTSSNLYWITGDTLWKANLDGSNPQAVAADQRSPIGVAASTSNLYWANPTLGTITAANLDGSNPAVIITDQNGPTWVAEGPQ